MSLIVRIILSLAVLAIFVLGSGFLVGGGTISSNLGLVLWVVGIVAAVLVFVKTKKK